MPPKTLYVVMPVYNEGAIVSPVVKEWLEYLPKIVGDDFVLLIVDDGSTDQTPAELEKLKRESAFVEIYRQKNAGHGQACVQGYRLALAAKAQWIFQIDSDGQCVPEFFEKLWNERQSYPVLYGYRRTRDDGRIRWWVSRVLSLFTLLGSGIWVKDSNVPYRLMKSDCVSSVVEKVPLDFYLANILVALFQQKQFGIVWRDITFRERLSGPRPSTMRFFFKNAKRLWQDLQKVSF